MGCLPAVFSRLVILNIGKSILEEDKVELAKTILEKAKTMKKELILPLDFIVADKFENTANIKIIDFDISV